MGKGTFIALLALLVAVAGAAVAFAAYFKHRNCALCDDLEDDLMEDDMSDLDYYATQVDDDPEEEFPDAPEPAGEPSDDAVEDPRESDES